MERNIILLIHSILGIIVFTTGLLQILLKKGGTTHRVVGQIYLYAWLVLLISGAYLGGLLITIIGVFGFYFALTGSRIGNLKNKEITLFEKAIFSIGGLVAVSMIYYAITLFLKGEKSYSIIFTVFGGLFLFQTVQDIWKYNLIKPLKKQIYGKSDWYFEHFTRMCISFIAAVTAFTSIQNLFKNNTLNFLMPTIAGIILINIASKLYKKKLKIVE
jgi:hypothetical protein